ncbi:MAG: UDP-glucose/GDP-mannose dehydrogenase family protein, partial [Gemmatimonadetes bacterium]|nr:UDP-glucose/GDP-mannose dehydrogenase family protein [Gemmatimonadota bacterium]
TVPVGSTHVVERALGRPHVTVVSNPEFLREGSAVRDFMHPDRVVIGAGSQRAMDAVVDVYRPLYQNDIPMVLTGIHSAEMIKYASNALLAAKISFINEIAGVCEHYGADVTAVARGMGLDERIGPRNLSAGAGYGGSCFPKDVQGLAATARRGQIPAPLIDAIDASNVRQRQRMVEKLRALLGDFADKTVCLLGLSFKPDTDDIREAPALEMVAALLAAGARVQAYDPAAMAHSQAQHPGLICCDDPYEAAQGADAVVLMTEWNEFRNMDLPRILDSAASPRFLDCRNIYDPQEMASLGFEYVSIGRPTRRPDDGIDAMASWMIRT